MRLALMRLAFLLRAVILRAVTPSHLVSIYILPNIPIRGPAGFGAARPYFASTFARAAFGRASFASSGALAKKIAVVLRFWRSPWPPELDFEASWLLSGPFWEAETPVFRVVLAAFARSVLTSSEANKTL